MNYSRTMENRELFRQAYKRRTLLDVGTGLWRQATAGEGQLCGAENEDYAKWRTPGGDAISARNFYRVAWRTMAATTGFRTIYPSLIPPAAAHVDLAMTAGATENNQNTAILGTALSSFLLDFQFRSSGSGHIRGSNIEGLAVPKSTPLLKHASKLYLQLNCLTSAYAPLWEELTGEKWTEETPIRNAKERFHAQNAIDAIIAISFDITSDELCMIYRTQFPVMRRYDQEDLFDANGRRVPKDIIKLQSKLKDEDRLSEEERTWTHPQSKIGYLYEYPFNVLDREADLRTSYAQFSVVPSV